jgi:hypothetical protein
MNSNGANRLSGKTSSMVGYPFTWRLAMRYLVLAVVLSAALAGCSEKESPLQPAQRPEGCTDG